MTKPIEGVSERILSCAKEGFLEKGYADASLDNCGKSRDNHGFYLFPVPGPRKDCLALWWNRQQEAER